MLPLGGEVASPLGLAPPFLVKGQLVRVPDTVPAARVQADPTAALAQFATALGVPGPPVSTGGGLAYNLGATSGYQLTSPAGNVDFDFHPNSPVHETGSTPSVAAADAFVKSFLRERHLPYPHEGLEPVDQLTRVNGADRTVVFQWTQNGLPLVRITGQPEEVAADVAADYRQRLSLVGLSGAVPTAVTGAPVKYPSVSPDLMIQDLNRRLLSPDSYRLSPSGQPFPSSSSGGASVVLISGASLVVVDSAGYAVPALLFTVSGPTPSRFVTCAAATYACAPLRYVASPSG